MHGSTVPAASARTRAPRGRVHHERGFTDEGSWLGAPAGLVRLDGTLKPTYDVLLALVRGEWWTPAQTLVTAADGRVTVEGVAGSYRVSAGDASAELALHAATAVVEETAQLRA